MARRTAPSGYTHRRSRVSDTAGFSRRYGRGASRAAKNSRLSPALPRPRYFKLLRAETYFARAAGRRRPPGLHGRRRVGCARDPRFRGKARHRSRCLCNEKSGSARWGRRTEPVIHCVLVEPGSLVGTDYSCSTCISRRSFLPPSTIALSLMCAVRASGSLGRPLAGARCTCTDWHPAIGLFPRSAARTRAGGRIWTERSLRCPLVVGLRTGGAP